MKKRNTKRALISSVLSLVLCLSMLIGTTLAWFTDSVTSSNNIIKSGNLDVTMEWAKATETPDDTATWTDAAEGAIFDYDLWEPGYVEAYHIKIENEGTLALKYKLNIVANGEVSILADVIDVYYVDPATKLEGRADLTEDKRLGTLREVLAALGTTGSGNLLAGDKDVVTIALKMQESAGNDYQNKSIGTDFAIQLVATQFTAEEDAFDKYYDEDASYMLGAGAYDDNGVLVKSWDAMLKDGEITVEDGALATYTGTYEHLAIAGVDAIAGGVFDSNTTIKSVAISEGVTTVGNKAFNKASNLKSVTLPSTLTTLGYGAFIGTGIESITIPGGTTLLDRTDNNNANTFADCTALKTVIIEEGVTSLPKSCFSGCTALTSVIIPSGMETLARRAFYDCLSLTEVYLLSSDCEIGDSVFGANRGGFSDMTVYVVNDAMKQAVEASLDDNNQNAVSVVKISASTTEEIAGVISSGSKIVCLENGEYELKGNQADGVTIMGLGDEVKVSNLTNFAGNGTYGAIWRNMNFENVIFTEKVYTMADGAQSVFTNCTFEQGFRGGYSSGTGVVFEGCTFYDNSQGFAMHFEQVKTKVAVTNCNFVEGTVAFGNGSGTTYKDAIVEFTNCTFSGVTTRTEYFDAWASCSLTDCTFTAATEIWHEQPENGETVTLVNTTGATVVEH